MKEKIIFAKYNTERKNEFCIVTEIVKRKDEKYFIRKKALFPEAKKHLQKISRNYFDLKNKYECEKVELVNCYNKDDSIEFDYVNGKSMENLLDGYWKNNDIATFCSLLENYVDYIMNLSVFGKFRQEEEFIRIFGKQPLSYENTYVSRPVNIDLIFSNIICKDDIWFIIDYEWIFDFDIPVRYILYRTMKVFLANNYLFRHEMGQIIQQIFKISTEEMNIFQSMEEHFQRYVCNKKLVVLKKNLQKEIYDIRQFQDYLEGQEFQIFLDYGKGFNEIDSYKLYREKTTNYTLTIPVSDEIKQLRVDPGDSVCEVQIFQCKLYQNDMSVDLNYITNGENICENKILYAHKDPQIIIKGFFNAGSNITLKLRITILPIDIVLKVLNERKKNIEMENRMLQLQNNIKKRQMLCDKLSGDLARLKREVQELDVQYELLQRQKESVNEKNRNLQDELNRIKSTFIGKIFFQNK